jgi:hypothetical protein
MSRDEHFSLLSASVTLRKGFIECLCMPDFLVLLVYLHSGNGEGWNHLLHGGPVEGRQLWRQHLHRHDDMETFISIWQHEGGDDLAVVE